MFIYLLYQLVSTGKKADSVECIPSLLTGRPVPALYNILKYN